MVQNLYLRHILQELAATDQHIATVRGHVVKQGEMVAWRQSTGRDSDLSWSFLLTLEAVLESHEGHRQRLLRELTQ